MERLKRINFFRVVLAIFLFQIFILNASGLAAKEIAYSLPRLKAEPMTMPINLSADTISSPLLTSPGIKASEAKSPFVLRSGSTRDW